MSKAGKIAGRVAFCLLPLVLNYFRFKFFVPTEPLENLGEQNAGEQFAEGMVLFFDAIASLMLLCPLMIGFWAIGFSNSRFRKTVLVVGLVLTAWSTLAVLAFLVAVLIIGNH